MIKKVHIFILALFISAALPFTGITNIIHLSAQDNKTESAEFTSSPTDQTKQDEQILIKVALVILIIWGGISFFLYRIERKLKKIEKNQRN